MGLDLGEDIVRFRGREANAVRDGTPGKAFDLDPHILHHPWVRLIRRKDFITSIHSVLDLARLKFGMQNTGVKKVGCSAFGVAFANGLPFGTAF